MNAQPHARDDVDDPTRTGVLIVGHGTREAAGLEEFHFVVRQAADTLRPMPVEPCFLEWAEPTIATGLERLQGRGARRVIVAPLLLFAAGHAKHDIPAAVAGSAAVVRSGLTWTQTEPLGLDRWIVELSVTRFEEALAALAEPEAGPIAGYDTMLLLVGRGASDPEAAAAMREFASLRDAARPVGGLELAFTALADPLVEQVLPRVAASRYRRIVVQPHLLFAGRLLDRLREQVAAVAAATPTKQWTMTGHLGPNRAVTAALLERISAACRQS